ncbi:MAG: hypothetical protein RR131_07695 [Anaerovorax sp.]
MKLMKKMGAYILICSLITGAGGTWCADAVYGEEGTTAIERVDVYLKPDITVKHNGEIIGFQDAAGQRVYPIRYEGRTYLPIRGICSIFEKAVEWDDTSKTVFIGKTFFDPAGITKGTTACAFRLKEGIKEKEPLKEPIKESLTETDLLEAQRVKAEIRPDILIMYNFMQCEAKDGSGNVMVPLVYRETTYFPAEVIGKYLNHEISLDPLENTVTLGLLPMKPTTKDGKPKDVATGAAIENMSKVFQREKELYNDVSSKIVELVKVKNKKEKEAIAKSISDDYMVLEKLLLMTKGEDRSKYTEEEAQIHKQLVDFSDSFNMYALVIENVAYMAAGGEDYALLSETLLYYALESQELMAKVSL